MSTSLFMSLDGVVEAENDWQFPYLDEETFAALTDDWERSDAVLLGRRSFEGFDDVRRSSPDSPVVGFLESVTRYVVSGSDYRPGWAGTTVLTGDIPAQVRRLKAQAGGNILVIGSPTLLRSLLISQLLDTFAVTVLPILVGAGPRLIPDDAGDTAISRFPLTLAGCRRLGNGTMHLTYQK
ncbi:MAG TPA: dihydrofolate reductase family protein, partial [Streptosporangiaceae bacterium]